MMMMVKRIVKHGVKMAKGDGIVIFIFLFIFIFFGEKGIEYCIVATDLATYCSFFGQMANNAVQREIQLFNGK